MLNMEFYITHPKYFHEKVTLTVKNGLLIFLFKTITFSTVNKNVGTVHQNISCNVLPSSTTLMLKNLNYIEASAWTSQRGSQPKCIKNHFGI